jgi:CDGSH-type Zn-finger protein
MSDKRPLVEITIYENGPSIVRGPFKLQTVDREEIDPKRAMIAQGRFGLSALKPFCDSNHVLRGTSRNNCWALSCAS